MQSVLDVSIADATREGSPSTSLWRHGCMLWPLMQSHQQSRPGRSGLHTFECGGGLPLGPRGAAPASALARETGVPLSGDDAAALPALFHHFSPLTGPASLYMRPVLGSG